MSQFRQDATRRSTPRRTCLLLLGLCRLGRLHRFGHGEQDRLADFGRRQLDRGPLDVTGTITDDGTMRGEGTQAGPPPLQRRLARLIAEDEQLAG